MNGAMRSAVQFAAGEMDSFEKVRLAREPRYGSLGVRLFDSSGANGSSEKEHGSVRSQ
jgi:hypothetical protein